VTSGIAGLALKNLEALLLKRGQRFIVERFRGSDAASQKNQHSGHEDPSQRHLALPLLAQVIDERFDLRLVQIELGHFPAGKDFFRILEQPF
jgi:hypothetical protein